jgi:hypothetical protein
LISKSATVRATQQKDDECGALKRILPLSLMGRNGLKVTRIFPGLLATTSDEEESGMSLCTGHPLISIGTHESKLYLILNFIIPYTEQNYTV